MFSALEVCYENALYKFTFDIDIDIGQTTLEIIGSKQSYALNWCKPNNDDDDDDEPICWPVTSITVVITEGLFLGDMPHL